MQITAKSSKFGNNRTDREKKGNNFILLPNKLSSSNKLVSDVYNREEIKKQNLNQIYSTKYNNESEDLDSYSNNCNTTRENYSKRKHKNSVGETSNVDEDVPKITNEKDKFKKQTIIKQKCEIDEAKLKVFLKTKSFDNFMDKKHRDNKLNYNSENIEYFILNTNYGKIQKSPYAIFSRANVKSRTIGRERLEKDQKNFNNYKHQRQTKGNFLSTDLTNSNITNNLAHSVNNKNYNNKLLNECNSIKKNLSPLTSLKSNFPKFERNPLHHNSIKEETTYEKDNLISENNLINNTKHSIINILERKKINLTNSKPPKTPKTSPKLSSGTPNKIPTINYISLKEKDKSIKVRKNSNNEKINFSNSSAKKISIRKLSNTSAKNENETRINDKSYKNNSEIKIINPNLNFANKIIPRNIIYSLITGINTSENTLQLKNRLGKTKLNDSNEKSEKKTPNLYENLKPKKLNEIPKFSLNEKFVEENIDDKINNTTGEELIINGVNFGFNSSEYEKIRNTPNLSTERTEMTDKTAKAIKKEEEFSPLKMYHNEEFQENLYTSSLNFKNDNNPVNKSSKNDVQLSSLEQIINNNLNYLSQNLKNDSPILNMMAKTKKFSYTDLTPMYSTNNPNKLKKSQKNFKKTEESDSGLHAVQDYRKRNLNFGQNDLKKNSNTQLDNFDSTDLIQNSSDEDEYDEMADKVNEQKHPKINNPIISRIKKNSFAVKISDEEFNFSEDEKTKITKVPIFKSKKLQQYAKDLSNTERRNSIEEKMSLEKLFHFIFIKNAKFKESFLSFLSSRDLLNFSFSTKLFRSVTKNILLDETMTKILTNNENDFHLIIWRSIMHHSKLSCTKFLRKEFLDNLFQKSQYEEEIRKDLLRTMPDDPTFQPGKENYKKLFNILIAYSNFNKKIGYAQGMNFIIASSLYMFVKEEEAFLFIDALVNKLNLNDIIGINEIAIQNRLEIVGGLIEKHTPSIVKYLEKSLLNHEFFTTGWIIPLLSNSIKKEILFKFWDFLLIYGWNFFNYFIVSILVTFQNKILAADPNTLSVFLKKLLKSECFEKSFDSIIHTTFEMLKKQII